MRRWTLLLAGAALWLFLAAIPALADGDAVVNPVSLQPGDPVQNEEMPTLDGGKASWDAAGRLSQAKTQSGVVFSAMRVRSGPKRRS